MKKITSFLIFCSGAAPSLLSRVPTETSKFVGIGMAVFLTGLFASAAAGYALSLVFSQWGAVWIAAALWGLTIFNLDRFIVSSMRKEGKTGRELLLSLPRVLLAIIISIVIARPLELKIFEKEIDSELVVMRQETLRAQELAIEMRFEKERGALLAEQERWRSRLRAKEQQRDGLIQLAQQEADGTGGSRQKNLGPIYKAKKADADRAQSEYSELLAATNLATDSIGRKLSVIDAAMSQARSTLNGAGLDGLASRLEAFQRFKNKSRAVAWADVFILLLFIAIETSPVIIKLLAPKGPYDDLQWAEEHRHAVVAVEAVAHQSEAIRNTVVNLNDGEKSFANDRLDRLLNRPRV